MIITHLPAQVIGPLQHLINAERRWRERANKQKDAVERHPSLAALRGLKPSDLGEPEALWTSDCSQMAVARVRTGKAVVSIRQTSLSHVGELGKQALVMRERRLAAVVTPMPFIPGVVKTMQASLRWAPALPPLRRPSSAPPRRHGPPPYNHPNPNSTL